LVLGSGLGGLRRPPPAVSLCHGIHELAPKLLGDPVVGGTLLLLEGGRVDGLLRLGVVDAD
jgi:hypothetical protein